ncbi:MAG: HNH endonuclease [Elusimicrobia bacterium]|nr:HNH endonuclease [Elusimicrobiota bacterium]MDE2426413.1 HNH endonuclease [Elusimicrobiota bacterium]
MSHVLILNSNMYAIQVAPWERALTLLYLDRAQVVDEEYRTYDFRDWIDLSREMERHPAGFIHTPYFKLAIPEVIALRFFDRVPQQAVPFTRRNIYHHYGYRCCYCSRRFPTAELNLDHVVPRSRGGLTDWTNIVTSCIPCNLRKGDRLPKEAGMKLAIPLSLPRRRSGLALMARCPVPMRRSWQRFVDNVYWDSALEEN